MANTIMHPVILSGGSGTRLWPVSRAGYPKQFCPLFEEPLEVMTMKRLREWGELTVIGHRSLKALSNRMTNDNRIEGVRFVGEPMGRDTAPAVALACRLFEIAGTTEAVVGIFPSDHLVRKQDVFHAAVESAVKKANEGFVVTLGLKPTFPATGYGYIQTEKIEGVKYPALAVQRFHEKPRLEKAQEYVQAGTFFWNSGIFIFRVRIMIDFFKKFQPELWSLMQELKPVLDNVDDVYAKIKPVSFDYAIMEKIQASQIRCVPFEPDWNDVGSWDAVAEEAEKSRIRATPSEDSVFLVDSKDNYVHVQEEKVYGFLGVENLIVVDTPDALLITEKGRSQDVKPLVEKIKDRRPEKVRDHLFEIRPWGNFEVLKNGETFKSKVIVVNPGQRISYQSHAKREEHWVVVDGFGEVTLDEKSVKMERGSYIKIPLGAKHRILNTGNTPLRFIEVQLGTYFGEDDIVRHQDDYFRK